MLKLRWTRQACSILSYGCRGILLGCRTAEFLALDFRATKTVQGTLSVILACSRLLLLQHLCLLLLQGQLALLLRLIGVIVIGRHAEVTVFIFSKRSHICTLSVQHCLLANICSCGCSVSSHHRLAAAIIERLETFPLVGVCLLRRSSIVFLLGPGCTVLAA